MTEKFRIFCGSIQHPVRGAVHTHTHTVRGAACGVRGARCARTYRASSGTYRCGYFGPMYSARGRMSRLFAYCSSTCAVHPDMRLTAKIGVKRSMAMPSAWYVDAE